MKSIKNEKKYKRYSTDTIHAFEAVKTKGMSVRRAAHVFRVPVQTLRDRIQGKVDPTNLKLGSDSLLS